MIDIERVVTASGHLPKPSSVIRNQTDGVQVSSGVCPVRHRRAFWGAREDGNTRSMDTEKKEMNEVEGRWSHDGVEAAVKWEGWVGDGSLK